MATQSPGFTTSFAEFAAAMLAERELVPRARVAAEQVSLLLPNCDVVVYAVEDQESPAWRAVAAVGDISVHKKDIAIGSGTLGQIAQRKAALIFPGSALAREDYAHLDVRRTVVSVAYVPILIDEMLLGAIEVLSYDSPISEMSLEPLGEVAQYAAIALATAIAYENERNQSLASINRLTQMYDLEKVFNSTLEFDALLPIIAGKFQEILNAQAVNLWLVEQHDTLLLMHQAGNDPAVSLGQKLKTGEGIAAEVGESGQPLLIDSADDERLARRNRGIEAGAAMTLMAAPIFDHGAEVGVVEVINKLDGTAFEEDDLFALTTMCETAAGALHNASLLQAERKVEILETLVKVSQEITSTLNLDRVLHAVVNGPQAVIPYERAAIALEQRGRTQLKAVSGVEQIMSGDADIKRLNDLLQWASIQEELFVVQHDEQITAERPETREKFREYFAASGARGFYALPLSDDLGRIGTLCFESSDPGFLSEAHFEMIRVLAGQVTVAVRNAAMYREVPFIGVLEPLLKQKTRFLSMEKGRRMSAMALAGLTLLFLAIFPLPMRLDGEAAVSPLHRAQIQPQIEGVVKKIYVHEGDSVQSGAVLADLADWDYRAALEKAQASYGTALAEMNRAQADFWGAEVERARQRLEQTHLRSPIAGLVATPHIETFIGRHIQPGDSFAEIVDSSSVSVDVALDEDDVPLAARGAGAAVKLDSYPARTFRGKVAVVSPASQPEGDRRIFYARVEVSNPEGAIRTGMRGRGKVSAGWHPAGFVLLRGPALWLWSKLWSWFGF
jgi:multidrug efflux pump subunit AcrA (membrane-fusion protein)